MTRLNSAIRVFLLPSLPSVQNARLSLSWSVVILVLAAAVGCTDGKATATGKVTFDGKPVTSGVIAFVRSDGKLTREGGAIANGSYTAALPPGTYKVELNAQKVVGKRKQKGFDGKDEEVEITEELFAERYNTKTELTAKIDSGPNTVNFDIKSGK